VCGVIAAGIVVAGGYYLTRGLSPTEAHAQEPGTETEEAPPRGPSVRVEVICPRKGGMDRTTVQPGTVQSYESAQLFSEVSGYLKTQTVDIGDRVKRGQVLATLDVPELEKQVQRNEAVVKQAGARVRQMNARVASAKADRDAALAAVTQAQATAKSAEAWRRFREKQLSRMKDLFDLKSIDERLVDETQERFEASMESVQKR
jgi:multidrug efflux pump subunit AcrA (membrane-fusion protein)